MKSRTGFTKKEVIVVLFCVAFLVINLGAIGTAGRERAKELVCMSNLRQWAAIFQAYTSENDGKFYQYKHKGAGGARWWICWNDQYLRAGGIGTCPSATRSVSDGGQRPYALAFKKKSCVSNESIMGSYCPNGWLMTFPSDPWMWTGQGNCADHWHSVYVTPADNIPLFTDSQYHDAWPWDTDAPPPYLGYFNPSGNRMTRVTAPRHNGGQNMVFADFSCRKVGLKQLWRLKWSRVFDTGRNITWPEWMSDYKDF